MMKEAKACEKNELPFVILEPVYCNQKVAFKKSCIVEKVMKLYSY